MAAAQVATQGRWRTALRRIARATALAGGALALCLVAAGLALNTAFAHRLVARALNRSLAGYFCGQVTVEQIGSLGFSGIRGVRVRVTDPAQRPALTLDGLDARIAVLSTVREVLLNRKQPTVTIDELSLGQLTLLMQTDAAGDLNLQRTFQVCAPPAPSSRAVRFSIRRITVAHLLAHVNLLGIPAFDAQLKDVDATLALIPGKLGIDVTRFSLETRGVIYGADMGGRGSVRFVLPLDNPRQLMARMQWAGSVYGTDLSADIQWLAGSLRVGLDAPQIPTQSVRRVYAEFPPGEAVSVRAELQGSPPDFALRTQIARGQGTVDVAGDVKLGDQKRAELHLAISSIDLRQLVARAPTTRLNASADLSAQQARSGQLSAELRLELPPSTIAGIATPPISVQANFLRAPDLTSNLDARIMATEPGVPAELKCYLTANSKNTDLKCDGDIRAPRLDRVPRIGRGAHGRAVVDVQAGLDLSRGTVNAKLVLDATEFQRKGFSAGSARALAALHGPLKSPRIDLDLDARQLEIAGAEFSVGRVKAHGPLGNTQFTADLKAVNGVDVGLSGVLDATDTRAVHDLDAWFDHGTGVIRAHVKTMRAEPGGVAIDGALIEGLGEPISVSLLLAPNDIRVRATAKGVDLSHMARITQTGDYGGLLDVDVDLTLGANQANGRATLSLNHAQVGKVHDLALQAEVNLRDRDISAHVRTDCGNGSWLELQADEVRLGGASNELKAWRRWSGRVGIDANVDLAQLIRQLPSHPPQLDSLQGQLSMRGEVTRETPENARPNVNLTLQGTRLGVLLRQASRANQTAAGIGALQLQNIGANLSFAYDGESDQTHVRTQLSDSVGVVAALDLAADAVPYAALLASPLGALAQLQSVPMTAQLELPRRSMSALPGGLVAERTRGDVQAKLRWTGTLTDPTVDLEARLAQFRVPSSRLARPVDLNLVAHYDGVKVDGNLKASLDDRVVLEADAQLQTPAAAWLARGQDKPVPWQGIARARLSKFPLESIRTLGDSEVSGVLNGELAIDGLHRNATASLKLDTEKLRIRDLELTAGTAQIVIHPNNFEARIRLQENSAFAEARLSGGSKWGDALIPAIDDAQALRAAVSAERFRIATLLPFTGGLLSDLDGQLDAILSAEIDRRKRTTGLSGVASLHGGVFELAAGGGEFHDIDAKLSFKPDGSVVLESLTAQGLSGQLQLTANARFDAFGWASSQAHLWIPANSPIPLMLEGAGYGMAFGQIDALAVRAANQRDILVDVDVPSFNVTLPATSAHAVKKLEPLSSVKFGSQQSGGKFVPLATRRRTSQATPAVTQAPAQVKVNLNLGKEVKVTRENSLEVMLTGSPQLVLSNTVNASGQLQLSRGFLDIEGKRFDLEQGTITFVGDSTNPQADVTASWVAPDGTVVYAQFSGPLRAGKVTLRSDPALANNEIMALLLGVGGDSLSAQATNEAQAPGTNVIGLAQGAATQPINHALQDYGLGSVSTRVDTSAASPRPEVEVRIARDIALQIAWVLGTPPPGSNPDKTLFTIDWQFFRRWSLETTVGDAGTSIADVVWQYGY